MTMIVTVSLVFFVLCRVVEGDENVIWSRNHYWRLRHFILCHWACDLARHAASVARSSWPASLSQIIVPAHASHGGEERLSEA
jgi:hypothetical protein